MIGRFATAILPFVVLGSSLIATTVTAQVELEPAEFKRLIEANAFAAIIDVRTKAEWDTGHIENATLVDSLNLFGTSDQITSPADLAGCENCNLAVYCRSGSRSNTAIEILQKEGFKGNLYNGLGVSQWTDAGFELVTTDSVPAACATGNTTENGQCNVNTTAIDTIESSVPVVGGLIQSLAVAIGVFLFLV